jgi:hypothetical protein
VELESAKYQVRTGYSNIQGNKKQKQENNYEEQDDESQEEQVTWIAHNMATNELFYLE